MELKLEELTETQAKEISTWKYDDVYSMYNLPEWDIMLKDHYSLCDEVRRKNFNSYTNETNELVGFTNLVDEDDAIFLGIGINPKYCNQGLGKKIIKLALDKCKLKFPNKSVILEVRTWNSRAINCYKSQGFNIVDKKIEETFIGKGEFYVMKCLNH